jgi:transposase
MKQKRHTIEFKKEAVRYMVMEGESAASVAERLGINSTMLYRWKSQYLGEMDVTQKGKGQRSATEMAAEMDSLRKQLRRSERINEILKKTVGFLAKDEI